MAEKFLSKEGMDRFFEKIKSKFAPLDSPTFKGNPTVETPEFGRMTDAKEVINKEYATKLFRSVMEYVDAEKSAFHIRLSVRPEDWKENEGVFRYEKLKEKMQNAELDKVSMFVRIDTSRLETDRILDAHQNYLVGIKKDGVVFTVDKPNYELPIIVNLFASIDMTMWLGGN